MAYVPPHLRVSQDNKPKPTPVSPPSSSRNPQLRAKSRKGLLPDVNIHKSCDFINRFTIVLDEHLNGQDVEFARFDGETFAHLQHSVLYTLKAARTDTADLDAHSGRQGISPGNDQIIGKLSLQDTRKPVKFIIGALQTDLREVLERFKSFAQADTRDRIIPLMSLRFGRLLFQTSRGSFDWGGSYIPANVEKHLQRGGDLSKTFDNGLSGTEFTFLHELAHRNVLQSWSKERFAIEVVDKMRPDSHLWCVCFLSKLNEQSSNPAEIHHLSETKGPAEHFLEMKKVKVSPVRHMIGDVACIGKSRDIRLIFVIKEYLCGLTEAELHDLKSSFSKAYIDDNVKGGIRWPLGSMCSTSGRFKVVGSLHEIQTTVIGGGLRWRLQKCNRVEFKASSGRISYEVSVKPTIFNEFNKGHKEWSTEELMLSIEELLQQIWIDCI